MTTPEDPRIEAAYQAGYASMRHDPHVWFEALRTATPKILAAAALRGDLPAPTDDQIERLTTERDEANDRASEWAGKYSQAMTLRDVATKRAEAAEFRLDTERAEWDRRALVAAAVGGALVQPDVNQRVPDSSRAAGTSIGGDLPKPDEPTEQIDCCSDAVHEPHDWRSDVLGSFAHCAGRSSGVLPEQPQPQKLNAFAPHVGASLGVPEAPKEEKLQADIRHEAASEDRSLLTNAVVEVGETPAVKGDSGRMGTQDGGKNE